LIFWGGERAFSASPRPNGAGNSGLAWAPKVASAPRVPGPFGLAGCLLQSLPRAWGRGTCSGFLFLVCGKKPTYKPKRLFFTTEHTMSAQRTQRKCSKCELALVQPKPL